MKKEKELNPRQKKFVEYYLQCGDEAEAARMAGYSAALAQQQGKRLLNDPEVQKYRRQTEQKLFDGMGISSAWIGRRLVEIVDRCMQATPHMARNPETKQREPDGTWEFDPTGAMRALHELDQHLALLRQNDETASAVKSFEDWLQEQTHEGTL